MGTRVSSFLGLLECIFIQLILYGNEIQKFSSDIHVVVGPQAFLSFFHFRLEFAFLVGQLFSFLFFITHPHFYWNGLLVLHGNELQLSI